MTDKELGKAFLDGEIIYREGDQADCMYIILSGNVAVYHEADGEAIVLGEHGKGDTFGETGVFTGPVRTESARAVGAARVMGADYKFIMKKFRDDPSFAFHLIQKMTRRELARAVALKETLEELHRRQAELRHRQELAGADRETADYFDFAPVGAVDLDPPGTIRGINLAGASMLGSGREALQGIPFASFVAPESLEAYRNHLLACTDTADGVTTEIVLSAQAGETRTVRIFSYPKRESGKVVYRTVITDLTGSIPPRAVVRRPGAGG
jgi:CRP-like cAMP-binding protein